MRTNSINANNDFAKDLRGINRKVKLVLLIQLAFKLFQHLRHYHLIVAHDADGWNATGSHLQMS